MNGKKLFISALLFALFLGVATIVKMNPQNMINESASTNGEDVVLDSSKYITVLKSANTTNFLKSQLDFTESSEREEFIIEDNDTEKAENKKQTFEKTDTKKTENKKQAPEKTVTKKTKNKKKETKKYVGTFKITGYCSCSSCCGKSDGITASGTRATAGKTIAADTSRYPFGTKLVIDGHTYTVEDRGGAINGNRIDMFFDSHSEALQWGVRYCDVYVMR